MSSHMVGGCPPRSAVASGPLKCELNFSAGSCAFGLFVTRRLGESERVSGPGATPPLAPSPVRIGSELSAAMPRSKEATSSKLFGCCCCAAHGHNRQQATSCATSKHQQRSSKQQAVWLLAAAAAQRMATGHNRQQATSKHQQRSSKQQAQEHTAVPHAASSERIKHQSS